MKTKLFIVLMILGLVFTSCEDWLKVNSETELSQDDMFSSDEGFHTFSAHRRSRPLRKPPVPEQ